MIEIALRLLSSALGYVTLVLMLRGPEPIRTFALYLPSSILVTLALDLGRGETALRQGLAERAKRRLQRERLVLTGVGVVLLALLPFGPLQYRTTAFVGLALSGALQAYVDIILRLCLFDYRRSRYLYLYAVALNSLTLAVAGSIAFGVIQVGWGLALYVLLPTIAVSIFARLLDRLPVATHCLPESPRSPRVLLTALLYRSFPPAAYTAYVAVLTWLTPQFAASARALYFVFGFMHTRRMAREGTRTEILGTSVKVFLLTCLLSVPVLFAAATPARITWPSLALCVLITICASGLFSWFLWRYTTFLNEPDRRGALEMMQDGG